MLRCAYLTGTGRSLLPLAALVLCLASAQAQDPAAAATVVEMTGRVNLWRDSSPRALPWTLDIGATVLPGQVIETKADGFARLRVSDGSTFDVFPNSRVTFRANRGDWKDLLEVMLGRVKVYIQKLNGLPNNNRVTTPTAVISVRGTIFDVVTEDDEGTTFVSVDEGEVAVRNKVRGGEISLHPGESVRVFASQPLAKQQVDKGAVAQRAMRAAAQAFYELLYRRQIGSGSTSGGGVPGGGTVGSGDHDKGSGGTTTTPEPPPPPPPPPPPQ